MTKLKTLAGGMAVLLLGVVSVALNAKFGWTYGSTIWDKSIYAAGLGAADFIKPLIALGIALSWANRQYNYLIMGLVGFALLTVVSFSSSIGFASIQRDSNSTLRKTIAHSVANYRTELSDLRQSLAALPSHRPVGILEGEIFAAKQHRRWMTTRGCTNATVNPSRKFCTDYAKVVGELATAKVTAAKRKQYEARLIEVRQKLADRPAASETTDPQAKTISMALMIPEEMVGPILTILVAIVIEFGSGLGLVLIVRPGQVTPTQTLPAVRQPRVRDKQIIEPSALEIMTADVNPAQDQISKFLKECIAPAPGEVIRGQILFEAYVDWCLKKGWAPENRTVFGRLAPKVGFKKCTKGNRVKYLDIQISDRPSLPRARLGHMADAVQETAAVH